MVKKNADHFPVPGDTHPVNYLPRDIRLGYHDDLPAGHPIYGWDSTSETFQLWELGERLVASFERKARFVGFIHPAPPGRKNRRFEPGRN